MAKKTKLPTFDETLATLRGFKFDVGTPGVVAKPAGAVEIGKYGCAAVIVPAAGVSAAVAVKPGVVINGEIGHVLDKGYQKFIKTPGAERPATAEHLKALHKFSEELRQAIGAISLYNESMGTVSDEYMYDRVKGRNLPESQRATPAWELPLSAGVPGELK